ncbi:MAG TPA: hypothetical protein VHL31_25175 [Geminicoccus sp.]|uniref:hypothetical protein n=1 Tax=Geminicoccus sp. TaxID=2024832 RepID=UPI002E34D968|nr:hypothetical protein [Geminicoccus sp.]HEX2529573.1 hypothetical protein [Geminicoccus sp.]
MPTLKAPQLIRDHIHVDLLARAYARFVREVHMARAAPEGSAFRSGPSGHVEAVASFTARFARAMGPLLGVPTRWSAACVSAATSEPLVRCNGEPTRHLHPDFDEARANEELAAWYLQRFGGGTRLRGVARLPEQAFELA